MRPGRLLLDWPEYDLNEDVSLRFFRPGDEENLLGLIQRVFEAWPTADAGAPPIEHLRWKLSSHREATAHHRRPGRKPPFHVQLGDTDLV